MMSKNLNIAADLGTVLVDLLVNLWFLNSIAGIALKSIHLILFSSLWGYLHSLHLRPFDSCPLSQSSFKAATFCDMSSGCFEWIGTNTCSVIKSRVQLFSAMATMLNFFFFSSSWEINLSLSLSNEAEKKLAASLMLSPMSLAWLEFGYSINLH